ncbi:hypothetical protein ACIRN4_03155 [Pimelobacter simplex]|uniref:hypothetical protein n=1 Tax=Nocardioides simplex TaxID=2045 RepID=UPI00382C458B
MPAPALPRVARLAAVGLALPLATVVLVACGHENDARDAERRGPCPDVATSSAFAVGRAPDVDLSGAIDDMMCDGEISAAEDRCLRSPWERAIDEAPADEYAATPEEAVEAVAGPDTRITGTLTRRPRTARLAVELDGATGVYDVRRTPRGWVVEAGEGCASGAAVEPVDLDDLGPECGGTLDEATQDADGGPLVACIS